jgi:hypothetical protein
MVGFPIPPESYRQTEFLARLSDFWEENSKPRHFFLVTIGGGLCCCHGEQGYFAYPYNGFIESVIDFSSQQG